MKEAKDKDSTRHLFVLRHCDERVLAVGKVGQELVRVLVVSIAVVCDDQLAGRLEPALCRRV